MCLDGPGESRPASDPEWQQAFDSGNAAIKACLQHATDLLGAARAVQAIGMPGIAYHLAALALEEVGKTVLIGMASIPFRGDEAREQARRDWDDHVVKLFWAFWGPSFGSEEINREQIESYRGLARSLHEMRLASLYYPWIGDSPGQRRAPATESETDTVIGLAEAAIGMAQVGERRLDPETIQLMRWFSDTVGDPEKSKWVFSSKSMDKRVELEGIRPWVSWLKEQFDQSEAEVQQHISRELARKRPGDHEAREPKWQFKVRLFSASHSIRPKPLSWWNSLGDWVRLLHVGQKKKKNELIAQLTFPKSIPVRAAYQVAQTTTQRLIIALNIGSMGFFWYYLPEHVARFYEELTDLEERRRLVIENTPSLVLDWRQGALSEQDLRNAVLFLGLMPFPKEDAFEPFGYYDRGLALLSKNDIHFRCEPHAYHQFYLALRAGMRVHGDWDGASPFDVSFHGILGEVMPDEEQRRKYIDLGEGFREPGSVPEGITLAEVAMIKTLSDAYFLRTFGRLARERAHPEAEEPS